MEFPTSVVALLLACPGCGSQLSSTLEGTLEGAACRGCGAAYPVTDGILRTLTATELDQASAQEMVVRDGDAEAAFEAERAPDERAAATALMLQALGDGPSGGALLELGCGSGHFTAKLVDRFDPIVAVDFSLNALKRCAARLPPGANVALVHADITHVAVQRGGFRRCLSTLVSNLPTWAHREAMYRLAARALAPDGLFVFGNPPSRRARGRLRGAPKAYNYDGSGIFCQAFTRREIIAEVRSHFPDVDVAPGLISVSGAWGRLDRLFAPRLGKGAVERLATKVPIAYLMARPPLVSPPTRTGRRRPDLKIASATRPISGGSFFKGGRRRAE